jgi:hypothetical protein
VAHRWTVWIAAGVLVAAGGARAADYRAPRTPWGAPDLNGLWSNSSLTQLERPDELKSLVAPDAIARAWEAFRLGKAPKDPEDNVGGLESEWWETDIGLARIRGQARTSWIVAPADGKLPLTAAFKAFRKARNDSRKKDFDSAEVRDLGERCLDPSAAGPPLMNGGYNDNYQLVQTPAEVAIHAEYMHDVRVVRIGGRHPPPQIRAWLGDSIGHWEGQTLVVETTNFAPDVVDDPKRDPAADMKVVERFTRTGPGEITYAFSVTNPSNYAQTWQGEMVFRAGRGPIYEYACHEGNYALVDVLTAARHAEAGTGQAIAGGH